MISASPPATRYFEQQNTSRDRSIQRIATPMHGNANHEVGSLKQLVRKSLLFAADDKSRGKSVCERFEVHQSVR
jgi:hypothetical protein